VALVELLDGDLADDAVLEHLVRRLRDHPATAAAATEAAAWARQAVDALTPLPDSAARDALRDFAAAVVDRTA
jgi:heptaprenyl diphosphate synthase